MDMTKFLGEYGLIGLLDWIGIPMERSFWFARGRHDEY